jgi:pimeloyl-ACP methyl ester carboxylesterase
MLQLVADGVFAESEGTAPARVIALPGWMRPRTDFRVVLAGIDSLAVDFPGFGGASPEPDQPGGAAWYAELIDPVLAGAADRVVLLGHSFGGRVAVELARRRPDRVAGLVLTGVPLLRRDDRPTSQTRPSMLHRLARTANRFGVYSDAAMEARRRRHGSADYQAATGVMREVLVTAVRESYDAALDDLASRGTPVELVWGASDNDVPVRVAERIAARIPQATLSVVPGGHLLPLEHPAALTAALHRVLAT